MSLIATVDFGSKFLCLPFRLYKVHTVDFNQVEENLQHEKIWI